MLPSVQANLNNRFSDGIASNKTDTALLRPLSAVVTAKYIWPWTKGMFKAGLRQLTSLPHEAEWLKNIVLLQNYGLVIKASAQHGSGFISVENREIRGCLEITQPSVDARSQSQREMTL